MSRRKKKNTVHYIHRQAPNFTNKWSTDKSKVSKCIINNSVKRVQTREYRSGSSKDMGTSAKECET